MHAEMERIKKKRAHAASHRTVYVRRLDVGHCNASCKEIAQTKKTLRDTHADNVTGCDCAKKCLSFALTIRIRQLSCIGEHDGPPPKISANEWDDVKQFGGLGVGLTKGPNDDAGEHDNAADCAAKARGVCADGPRAHQPQNNTGIWCAHNHFAGFGWY